MVDIQALGFDGVDLANHVRNGLVRKQVHPEFPELKIYNYTETVQFTKRWDNITLQCRGLILNGDEIVARPWEKFFNLGERDNRIDHNAPVEVTDKKDGSLGILYQRPDLQYAIATRGSFASDQAIHATKVLNTKYAHVVTGFREYGPPAQTFLFEIIYPDNRIVCNYGLLDDLVLLGAVDKEYGYYHGPAFGDTVGWDGPRTEVFSYNTFGEAFAPDYREGAEGVVIRSGSKMVKVKQADYVELHRIITNLSPRTIWAAMGDGRSVQDICNDIPDEFHADVKRIGNDLINKASDIAYAAGIEFQQIKMKATSDGTLIRKRFANEAKHSQHKALLFRLLDEKDIHEQIWTTLRPEGDARLVEVDGE